MPGNLKFLLIFFSSFLLISCKKFHQKADAANIVNTIDSLTYTLGPPADKLVRLFKELNESAEATDSEHQAQMDSLKIYYEKLIQVYDNAIRIASALKDIKGSHKLKQNFLHLLRRGREPWLTTIPIYLKGHKNGLEHLSNYERGILDSTSSIFMNSGQEVLEISETVAIQEEAFIKKYDLQLHESRYR